MTTYLSRPSTDSTPPGYTPHEVELARLDSASPSTLSTPPPYDDEAPSSSPFHPTVHFQIQTPGKPWLSLPLPTRPEPIPIFSLHPEDSSFSTAAQATPHFTCIRPERSSGSCYLTTTTSPSSSSGTPAAVATTTYRFGPNRPPLVRLFSPHATPLSPTTLNQLLFSKEKDNDEQQEPDDAKAWDTFPITSLGLLTRAVSFHSSRLGGTFQWRYASRKERHAAALSQHLGCGEGGEISSLLILERVVRVATAQNIPGASTSTGGKEEIRTVVAYFLRGETYRTPGSSGSSAGNGGRLVMDLSLWEAGDVKMEREMAVAMVVATCLVMLKREVDRRRAAQIAVMAGAVGN
ncbi:hypothetical protein C8A01DRAFT_38256 [Parachaetomium inaequale]|uniref:Uncharacterized protein n=1 Tax=Parachaetomium inaequale TaxID=2588326 RepID=A0AAN6PBE5_9PEZI|nr:hypothetical protein C8A01DRAFT_38256 [Parachaetomium inaequale]